VANCFAQSEALMQGKSLAQAQDELIANGASKEEVSRLAAHKVMKGNTPSNTLLMQSLTPHCLGAILALYEHKIFVQGCLWQVNSYDQWGVELGKQLSEQVLALMSDSSVNHQMSPSSVKLIEAFVQK
ncbi:MAG TPA: glucose-6-phosphate isomerase, partial [Colwellia sp.]|nr:glucose-6-phosphate isomerase [Colwellia sp.]